ncbi:MAG: Lrp/AsnC family transcriptional regulator [Actinomycetales bacterium]
MRDGSNASLDDVDWQILAELQADARLSFSALSKRVHLSGPAVAERVRRLEEAGIITGYHANVDATAVGWPVLALVRLACYGPTCILRSSEAQRWPNILQIHRVTGPDCSVLMVVAASMPDFERLIDALAAFGTPSSTLVLSTPLARNPLRSPHDSQRAD